MSNIFLAVPSYDGGVDIGAARSIYATASRLHRINPMPVVGSLLPTNCNGLLATALNHRQSAGLTWFAQLHSDIEPEHWWLDKLIEIAEANGADLLSAVVPIKDQTGATSTAISQPGKLYGYFTRLTQQQVRHPEFPDTFGISEAADALARLPDAMRILDTPREALLANTGCMVYRLAHWRPGICFANLDDIQVADGRHTAVFQSEDWVFSKRVAEHGGKVMATRLLTLKHWGKTSFDSAQVWGQPVDVG